MFSIEVKDGKVYITHDSGKVVVMERIDYELLLAGNIEETVLLENDSAYITDIIEQIGSSIAG